MAPSALLQLCFAFLFSLVWGEHVLPQQPHLQWHKRVDNTTVTPFTPSTGACYYWLENIKKQGRAPFQNDSSYQVFRNVKEYGAVGDGITDDTIAINRAVSDGGRCAPGSCQSTTTTPAIVYFPPGTYLISSSVIDYYYTQLIGNPNCLPTLKATSNFTGLGLIDGDPYGANGLSFGATNVFWRQVRNFILDMTNIPAANAATGVHWPTGQATSLQNIEFRMSAANGTQHQGLFIESGSGGFLTDLVFHGGLYGANLGNQQFTMRNLTFYNAVTAVNQLYDWGWTYTGISINNCQIGFNLSTGGYVAQSVGSVLLFDSEINNTPVGVITAFRTSQGRYTNGTLILENVALNNVPVAVRQFNGSTILAGSRGNSVIAAWGQGHSYTPNGPVTFQGPIAPNNRPASLLSGDAYYQRSKPQYEQFPASQFISARDIGATGDGVTDDTAALQAAITAANAEKKILFIDAGDYKVTASLYIPAGTVVVGEAYPVILGSGAFFSNVDLPQPIVSVGHRGEIGTVEWSDTIVSTQGNTAGAILFELNLQSGPPAGSNLEKRQNWQQWSSGSGPYPSATAYRPGAASSDFPGWDATDSAHSGYPSGRPTGSAWVSSYPGQPAESLAASSYPGQPWGSSSGYPGYSHSGSASSSPASVHPQSSTTSSYVSQSTWAVWSKSSSSTTSPSSSANPGHTPAPYQYVPQGPSGLWDVHARVGGFAGSRLQLPQCPTTATVFSPPGPINSNCIAAFMTMHITSTASNFYLENVWLWVADHDVEDPNLTQITIYAGRGLLIESTNPVWLWGTAVEHHTLYQYQLNHAATIYMGMIQTETAYYQPNPPAYLPFAVNPVYADPDFTILCSAKSGFNFTNTTDFTNTCDGYGLRIIDSSDVMVYGAGFYSFFDNYNTSCSAVPSQPGGPYGCQSFIFSVEGNANKNIEMYTLSTVGAQSMIEVNGQSVASYLDNLNVFPDNIAVFRYNA